MIKVGDKVKVIKLDEEDFKRIPAYRRTLGMEGIVSTGWSKTSNLVELEDGSSWYYKTEELMRLPKMEYEIDRLPLTSIPNKESGFIRYVGSDGVVDRPDTFTFKVGQTELMGVKIAESESEEVEPTPSVPVPSYGDRALIREFIASLEKSLEMAPKNVAIETSSEYSGGVRFVKMTISFREGA